MKKYLVLILAVVLISALVFAGCSSAPAPTPAPPASSAPAASTPAASTPAPAAGPIKIGAILELTGSSARWGPVERAGMEVAFEQVGYKVAGRTIQFIVEDGGGAPATENDKAKKLVEMDKVNVILGPLNAAYVLGIAPYVAQNKVVEISLSQMPVDLKKFDWNFMPFGADVGSGYYTGMYSAEKLGYKTVTTIGADFVSGYNIAGSFNKGFSEKGGTLVGSAGWAPIGTQDYSPYLGALKNADFCSAWSVPGKVLVKQYYDFGLWKKMPLVWAYGNELTEPDLAELGDAAKGLVSALLYDVRIDTPENTKFVADFQKKFNYAPTEWEMEGYDSAAIVIAALNATGGDTNPDKLKAAIANVKVNLPAGPFAFAPSHFGLRNMYIVKVDQFNGKPGWAIQAKYPMDPDALPQGPYPKY
jgi:branched-chain amino acid transport system substrate-binding protein